MKHIVATCMLGFIATAFCYGNIAISNLNYSVQPDNVLRVEVSFSLAPAARGYVEYCYVDGADTVWAYTDIKDVASAHQFTMMGLLPQTNYRFRAAAFDETGIHYGIWNNITTAAIPSNLPSIMSVPVADASNTGGYALITTMRLGIFLGGDVAQMYDRKGNVIWYQYLDSVAPGGLAQCKFSYPIANQRLLITSCHEIVEMGFDGQVHHRSSLQGADTNYYYHHEVLKKPNGNYLAIAAKPIRLDFSDVGASADSLVMAESILEVDTNGSIVWQWNSFAELDTNNLIEQIPGNIWAVVFPGSGSWLHANALSLDRDGGILLSLRKSSQVFKINPANKDILFVLGNLGTITMPISQRFKGQHSITAIGANQYMVYDNLGKDTVSRVAEYFVNSYNNSVFLQREYVLPKNLASNVLGSAFKLPNDNTFIGSGLSGAIMEVDNTGAVLLDMRQNEQLYRAYSIPSLYAAPPAITFAVADTFCGPTYTPVTLTASPAPGFFTGPGVTGDVFDPEAAGIGVHEVVYHYGWHTKKVRINVGCVGIEAVDAAPLTMELYPNPASGVVNFSYQLPLAHQADWSVIDLTGKVVAQGSIENQQDPVNFGVDLSHLGKGFYVAVLNVGGQRVHARLILQ